MPETRQLIIFSRFPEPGKTKTRLIPALGPEGAATLQRHMSGHTLLSARVAACVIGARIQVRFAGGSTKAMRRWLGDGTDYISQGEGDLGQRMQRAFQESFNEGSGATVIIGTDCPTLSPTILEDAFTSLRDHDLVIGPAADGGYYLVGLRCPMPEIFQQIDWGTETVLRQTLAAIEKRDPSIRWLTPLNDVDTVEDLPVWDVVKPPAPRHPQTISVVIPALNEANSISHVIETAQAHADEIILVDGGSTDDTRERAEACGASVLTTPAGRGRQMNAGALAATNDSLLFLHADTLLPDNSATLIREALARPGVVCGAFKLGIDGHGLGLRLIEGLANLRSRLFAMPYGDQAIFVRSDTFRECGGFGDLPIMEDFDLMRRLRNMGSIAIAPGAVCASGRRWRRLGLIRTTLINQRIIAGYCLGEPAENLVRHYNRNRGLAPE